MRQEPVTRRQLIARTVASGCAAATAVVLTGCGSALPEAPAATVAPFSGNVEPPLLVDAAWLHGTLTRSTGPPRILDLSSLRTYRRGHLPGAVHAWWQDTMEVDQPDDVYGTTLGPGTSPNRTSRLDLLKDLGIADETDVVAYDDEKNRWAARMVWFLRYVGHDRAAVLDGGLAAWRGFGGDVEDGEVSAPQVSPPTILSRDRYYCGTAYLAEHLADASTAVIDIRSDEEVRDNDNGLLPTGRIPGSTALPWTETLRDDAGRLKDPAELSRLFRDRGVTPDRTAIVIARYGVEAAHGWWVLKLLGYADVLTYDPGWAGWSTTPGLPIDPLS
jgi:thiosulfate/3-mercaptopyruvate sulfurtransferase